MAIPLPSNLYEGGTLLHVAYQKCLDLEAAAREIRQSGIPPPVCARVLGQLMLQAPTDEGRANVANEISSCENNKALFELAQLYVNHFIRCCESFLYCFHQRF